MYKLSARAKRLVSRIGHRRPQSLHLPPMHLESLEKRQLLTGAIVSPDVVIEWDNIALNTIRIDHTYAGPGWSSRNLAMVHGAIYDAVNSIDQTYEPYLLQVKAPKWASITAAAATAANLVLSNLFPAEKSTFDAALAADLATIPHGLSRTVGTFFGRLAANAMLNARANDGADTNVTYPPGTEPGQWRPTPPDYAPAWGPNWGAVKPFVINDPNQFLPPPFPALNTPAYTADYNEVKSLGDSNSTTRTPDQTQISDFWAYDIPAMGTPMVLYNQITQKIARQEGNNLVENARLFALTNLAMADAGIACWNAKFINGTWRPITGIQLGNSDGNPDTVGDPNWTPLGAPNASNPRFTPPFPAYTSGHATFGSALFNVLAQYYGTDNIQFTATSDELPGVTRSYSTLTQANDENAWSRIYMGVHWSFDRIYGESEGAALANYIYPRILQPVDHPHHHHDDHKSSSTTSSTTSAPTTADSTTPSPDSTTTTASSAPDPTLFSTVPFPSAATDLLSTASDLLA